MNRRIVATSCLLILTCFICTCSSLMIVSWLPSARFDVDSGRELTLISRWQAVAEKPYLLLLLGLVGGLGLLCLVLGLILEGQAVRALKLVWRHAYAVLGTLIAFTGLAFCAAILSGANDAPLAGVGILLVYATLLPRVIGLVVLLLLPVCTTFEMHLVGRRAWRWWGHVPVTALACGVAGVVVVFLVPSVAIPGPVSSLAERARLSLISGGAIALLSTTYWLFLLMTRTLVEAALRRNEGRTDPLETASAAELDCSQTPQENGL